VKLGKEKNLDNNSDINFKILFQGGHTKQVFEREKCLQQQKQNLV
jgi:hypothetical protein